MDLEEEEAVKQLVEKAIKTLYKAIFGCCRLKEGLRLSALRRVVGSFEELRCTRGSSEHHQIIS